MLQFLLTLCLSALLVLTTGTPTVTAAPDRALAAVRPIQAIALGRAGPALVNICTTTAINDHLWLTAEHCVGLGEGIRYISGDEVRVIMRDVPNDLAILHTPRTTAPAIALASTAPTYDTRIRVVGHPFGFPDALAVLGTVAHPASQFTLTPDYARPFMFLNVTGAPGNSGSGVFNTKGELVSVVQIGFCDRTSFCSMMAGVTWDVLDGYRMYWQ